MADIQYGIKEEMAQEIVTGIAHTLEYMATEKQLADIQRTLLASLEEDFVVKPTVYDYDELSIEEIRRGLYFLETGILDSPLFYILPKAMCDAVVEVLTQVLLKRETDLLAKGR